MVRLGEELEDMCEVEYKRRDGGQRCTVSGVGWLVCGSEVGSRS